MQLFGVSENPSQAAALLCDNHVISQAKETTQILYTALFLWDVVPEGKVDCTELGQGLREPYKPFGKGHPVVQWAAASRRHYRWTIEHAKALMAEYMHRSGKKHLCQLFLDHINKHIDAHGLPSGMPESITADEWLATLEPKKRGLWLPRIATAFPPTGCDFGVIAADMPGGLDAPGNWVLSYKQYYAYKRSTAFKRAMKWSGEGQLGAAKRARADEATEPVASAE